MLPEIIIGHAFCSLRQGNQKGGIYEKVCLITEIEEIFSAFFNAIDARIFSWPNSLGANSTLSSSPHFLEKT